MMTIHATVKEGRIVTEEPIPFGEGERLLVSIDGGDNPVPQPPTDEAFERFLDTVARLAPKANPNFAWNRDLAYDD